MGVVAAVCAAMGLLSGCFLLPNDAPIASFTATPDSGSAPLSVAFDASDSYDPDGGVASYRWTFGDGATGYGVFVTHVYATPGTYTAELTVQDLRRATGVAFEPIEVRAGTKYAIIVGIAAYAPPTPQLTYTDDDAMALRDRLASLPGWSADRITLLLNHEATVAAFRAALDALAGASPDDLLVVHFSGHGNYYKDGNGDEADGFDEALEFYDTALVDDTLALLLEQVPMSRIAVTIDTCYSGGQLDSRAVRGASADGARAVGDLAGGFLDDLDRIGARGPRDLDRIAKQLVALSASRYDEVSWEVASLRHGLFTYALLEALDGRADAQGDADGQTSAEECFAYVQPRVEQLALTLAQEVQMPQMLDHAAGELDIAGTP